MLEELTVAWSQNHLSKVCLADQAYNELAREAAEAQIALKDNLSEENCKQFIKAIDTATAADMRNVYLAYREGLKSGIRLIMEALL